MPWTGIVVVVAFLCVAATLCCLFAFDFGYAYAYIFAGHKRA